jgi:hypothetical protein
VGRPRPAGRPPAPARDACAALDAAAAAVRRSARRRRGVQAPMGRQELQAPVARALCVLCPCVLRSPLPAPGSAARERPPQEQLLPGTRSIAAPLPSKLAQHAQYLITASAARAAASAQKNFAVAQRPPKPKNRSPPCSQQLPLRRGRRRNRTRSFSRPSSSRSRPPAVEAAPRAPRRAATASFPSFGVQKRRPPPRPPSPLAGRSPTVGACAPPQFDC